MVVSCLRQCLFQANVISVMDCSATNTHTATHTYRHTLYSLILGWGHFDYILVGNPEFLYLEL